MARALYKTNSIHFILFYFIACFKTFTSLNIWLQSALLSQHLPHESCPWKADIWYNKPDWVSLNIPRKAFHAVWAISWLGYSSALSTECLKNMPHKITKQNGSKWNLHGNSNAESLLVCDFHSKKIFTHLKLNYNHILSENFSRFCQVLLSAHSWWLWNMWCIWTLWILLG